MSIFQNLVFSANFIKTNVSLIYLVGILSLVVLKTNGKIIIIFKIH